MSGTCSCGLPLYKVSDQTWTSPAEYECAVCTGGLDRAEVERMIEADEMERIERQTTRLLRRAAS